MHWLISLAIHSVLVTGGVVLFHASGSDHRSIPPQLKISMESAPVETETRELRPVRSVTSPSKPIKEKHSPSAATNEGLNTSDLRFEKPLMTVFTQPAYPRSARRQGLQGDVSVKITVANDGTVTAVEIKTGSGVPALDSAALQAARAARFEPARSNGMAVDSDFELVIRFRIE